MQDCTRKKLSVITHGEDLDGLGAQALVLRHYADRGGCAVETHRENYGSVVGCIRALLARELAGTTVVLSDLGLNENFEELLARLATAGPAGCPDQIIYYDHHEYTRARRARLESLGIECHVTPDHICTTKAIQQYLFPGDAHAEFLAAEALASDNQDPTRSKENRLLGRLIGMASLRDVHDPYLERVVGVLRAPAFYETAWLQREMAGVLAKYEAEMAEVFARRRTETVAGLVLTWSWSELIPAGQITTRLSERLEAPGDVIVALNPVGKFSMKTDPARVNAANFTRRFGGGGHADRAGFYLLEGIPDPVAFMTRVRNELVDFLTTGHAS